MPQPMFAEVPSLPMFVVHSGKTAGSMASQSILEDAAKVPSASDATVAGSEESSRKLRRKHCKKKLSAAEEAGGDGSSSRDDAPVHISHHRKHRHHKHKPHRSMSDLIDCGDELDLGQGDNQETVSHIMREPSQLETGQEQQSDSKSGSRSTRGRIRSSSQTTLLRKLEELQNENQDLTNRLQQMSHSSQDSGYPKSAAEEALQRKDEHIATLQAQIIKLEGNNKNLIKQRDSIQKEVEELRQQLVLYKADAERMAALQLQNKELNDDVNMLKNLVYRLNVELERYQQKLQKQNGTGGLPPLKTLAMNAGGIQEKHVSGFWENVNKNALKPLLEAYQETIREKDDLIHNYEKDLNKFVANCKQVITENEKLYKELEEARKMGEERYEEWKVLQKDTSVMQEQNDLLMNQLQVQKDKTQQVQTAYDERVAELTKENEMLVTKFHQYRGDLLTLKGQYSVLREEYERLKKDAENRIPFAVHDASVSECRRLFEELKMKYEGDKSTLKSQVQQLESQKPQLEVQLANLTAENKQFQIHIKTLDKLLKKTQRRCEELQNRLVTCQVSRDASRRQLQKAMTFAEELVAEQENLLRQLHAKQEENNSITRLGTTIVCRMGSLKTKLKTVQRDAWTELDIIEKRIRQQESGVERMKDEYHREVLRLRNLVKQKENIIGRLQKEKMKTQEELEVVWRAATSEDVRLKEKLKHVTILPEKDITSFRD